MVKGCVSTRLATVLCLIHVPLFAQTTAPAEDPKPSGGGLFGGLGKMLQDGANSLTKNDQIKSLREGFDSFYKSSSEELSKMLEANSDANAMMENALAYVDEQIAGRKALMTEAQIQGHAAKVIPLVEEVSARKFTTPAKVKSCGNLQMIQVMARDLAPQLERQMPDAPKFMVMLRSYLAAAYITPSLMGKYATTDGTVYFLPENIRSVMAEAKIDPKFEEQIVQIVIAHELGHALQDQEIDLDKMLGTLPQSPDAMQAFNATIEGHAVFLQNQVANRLGYTEAAKEASRLFHAEDLEENAWHFERAQHVQALEVEQTYLGGEQFIAFHHRNGGMERIWKIMASPPARSSFITQPATYVPNAAPVSIYKNQFAFLPSLLGPGKEWVYAAAEMGDFDLRSNLASVPREQREKIMRGLKRAVLIQAVHTTDVKKSMDIALFEFRDQAEVGLMRNAIQLLSRQQLTAIQGSGEAQVKFLGRQDLSASSGLTGEAHQFEMTAPFMGASRSTAITAQTGLVAASLSESESGLTQVQLEQLISRCAGEMKALK